MFIFHQFKFFIHPNFHLGIILTEEYLISSSSTLDVFFFESKEMKTMSKEFISNNCEEVKEQPKLLDVLSDELINQIFDSWTQSKGAKYVSDSRIQITYQDEYSVKAQVIGTYKYQTSVYIKDNAFHIECTCPVGRECKHLFALLKYIVKKSVDKKDEEITPFEEVFNQLLMCYADQYFELGFEIISLFKENKELNAKSMYKFLNDFDYYSNKAFIPFVIDDDVYNYLIKNGNNDIRMKLNKIYLRYQKALDGRNYSVDDVIIALVFKRRFEEVFVKNYSSLYHLSGLSKEGIIYAALHHDLDVEAVKVISKLDLDKNDAEKIFNHITNKAAKKIFYIAYQRFFNDLTSEELEELEYTGSDVYNLFLSSSSKEKVGVILNNYHTFTKYGEYFYLPGMIREALLSQFNARLFFNDLYKIIEELPDNSLLLKLDFKGDKITADQFIERWRGYDY